MQSQRCLARCVFLVALASLADASAITPRAPTLLAVGKQPRDSETNTMFDPAKVIGFEPADGETPIDITIPALFNRNDDQRLPITVEGFFVIAYVLLIASCPFILAAFDSNEMTTTQKVQSVVLFTWLSVGIYAFTNWIEFESGHFEGEPKIRSLTMVETIYFMTQIITTVGYGDIVPAHELGQVVVSLYVLTTILIIADMVSTVTSIVMQRAKEFASTLAYEIVSHTRRASEHLGIDRSVSGLLSPRAARESPRTAGPLDTMSQEAKNVHVHGWMNLSPAKPPYRAFLGSLASFGGFLAVGICFWHYYPGEEKDALTAVYMSFITLSTVGFGVFTADTEMGKAFGAFWMLFGVAALGAVIVNFTALMLALKEIETHNFQQSESDFKELAKMRDHKSEGEGSKLDLHDYLILGLLHSKAVTSENIEEITNAFSELKKDKDGKVSLKSMERLWS